MELINYEAITTAYSECVYEALVIQHAKHMRRSITSPVASLDLPHFPPLSHKWHDFRGRGGVELLDITCVDAVFSTAFFLNISHSTDNSASYYNKRTQVFM